MPDSFVDLTNGIHPLQNMHWLFQEIQLRLAAIKKTKSSACMVHRQKWKKAALQRWLIPTVSLALCFFSLCLYLVGIGETHRFDTPVRFPLDLKTGFSRSPTFYVNAETNYEITLEVDRTQPTDRLKCLMGYVDASRQCKSIPSIIDISWILRADGSPVAQGRSTNFKSYTSLGAKADKLLGEAKLSRNINYTVEVRSLKDATVFISSNPQIVLYVPSNISEGSGVPIFIAAFFLGAIGILGIFGWAISRITR